ncbi:MAG: polysaccharide deacetylase family protein [Vicingaceae bacterium]
MLLIYLKQLSPRSRYLFKTAIRTFLRLDDFKFSEDEEEFKAFNGAKFSYGKKPFSDELFFEAFGLLESRGISEISLNPKEYQGVPTLFQVSSGALPYDPFAASFYMLSRYEEYLPHLRDQYDRFTASESLAKKHDFLQVAVVDRWLLQVKELLQQHFPDLKFGKRKYSYLPTLDIDNAYAYKEKGFIRIMGSIGRNILKLDFKQLRNQLAVVFGNRKDPFDTFNYQLNVQKKYHLRPIYFFLLADYGLNDKNLSHENRHFQSLIKSIADYAEVGIHPSYGSNVKKEKVVREIKRLQRIVKRDIYRSRQHFLKLSLPETYRNLIEADIREDYTMGFAGDLGFRAGTCTPYPFYDLDEEVECKLTIYPFQMMEATLKYYLKVDAQHALSELKPLIDEVKAVNGTFVSLWHNESLSEEDGWEGWREVYEGMVEYAVQN